MVPVQAMREILVTEHEAGQRLDRFLRKLLKQMPLAAIFKHVRSGTIRVDGGKVAGDLRLLPGMKLQLQLPDSDLRAATKAVEPLPPAPVRPPAGTLALELRIVHQDDDVLVIHKPAGLPVHGGTGQKQSVADWLAHQRFGIRTGTFRPGPAHRLDRGTSGLLAIGLSPQGLRGLTGAFREGAAEKTYWAIVHGVPERTNGSVIAPLYEAPGGDRRDPKVTVDDRGRPARTDYEVVRTVRHMTLLKVVPHEGRQHQIRAHLAHLGLPIVGDARYGSRADLGPTFLLHAGELVVPHPRTGARLVLRDPLPASFRQMLATD